MEKSSSYSPQTSILQQTDISDLSQMEYYLMLHQ